VVDSGSEVKDPILHERGGTDVGVRYATTVSTVSSLPVPRGNLFMSLENPSNIKHRLASALLVEPHSSIKRVLHFALIKTLQAAKTAPVHISLLAALAAITTARLAPRKTRSRLAPHKTPTPHRMANIGSDDWLRWSETPLRSETGERERASFKVINACSRPLHVQWVTAAGQLKNRRRVAPGRGRLAILDNSVKNEHAEGTLVGDAFVIHAGLDATPPETIDALRDAEIVGFLACTTRDPARQRIVTVSDAGVLQRLFGKRTLVACSVGPATKEETRPLHPYVYRRETACGIIIDVDDRCYEKGERVKAFLADCEAAAKRLPKNAVAAIRDAGCRIVVHEETGKWTHMCYHGRRGQAWLKDNDHDEKLAGCVQLYRLDDYAGDRGVWGRGGSIVHELSHAYHDCYLRDGHENKLVAKRYDRAVHSEKLYDAVRVKGPQARPRDAAERRKLFLHLTACGCLGPIDGVARRHYAATNAAEFFAELSTAYLCRDDEDYNKWEPHNQKQLWQFDPDTCKLLERVWDGGEALDDNCDDEPPLRSLLCCRVLRWGKPTPCCRWGRGPLARDA